MNEKSAFLEILTVAFAAGETKVFAMAGEYFEIIDSVYPVDVRLVDRYGAQRGLMRNAENSFFIKAGDFQGIEITSATEQTIRFAFGTSEAGTRRTAGVVSVVDSSKSRTLAGVAFLASHNVAAQAAFACSTVLWNPPGSGFNLYVQRLRVSMSGASSYGTGHITSLGTGLQLNTSARVPKRIGATPAFECYETNASAFNGSTLALNSVFTATLGANVVDVGDLYEPVLIQPGAGFRVFATTINVGLVSTLELIQEAI